MPDQNAVSVADVLSLKGIQTVTMIDDAFDPISLHQIPRQQLDNFFAEYEQNSELREAAASIKLSITKVEDLTQPVLQALFDGRNTQPAFQVPLDSLFGGLLEAGRRDADEIRGHLESLRLSVTTAGSTEPVAKSDCKVFLLDYYLGPISFPEESIAKAVARAKEIYALYDDGTDKPIIILMSSQKLSDEQVKEFRRNSKLLGGMFQHIPKNALKSRESLERKLLAVAKALPVAHAIEGLIASIEEAINRRVPFVSEAMRSLSLEDYLYIQRLSLKEDGQPFGDYLVWLFGSEMHKQVFESEEVLAKQRDVDALQIIDLPPRQMQPSLHLAEMYKHALFREMSGELDTHPLGTDANNYPLLFIGDIFVKDTKLYMVINPECELAFSPGSDGRKFPATKSIMLIPGSLSPIQSPLAEGVRDKASTEMFVHQGKTFRITWDPKRVESYRYDKVREWADQGGYRREYRLRLLFALQIQHEFVTEFGRIGKPTAPPIFQPVRLELYCSDKNGKSKAVLGPLDEHGALISVKGETKCALDLNFIEGLCGVLGTCKESIQSRITVLRQKVEERRAANAAPVPSSSTNESSATPLGAIATPLSDAEEAKYRDKIDRATAQLAALSSFADDRVAQIDLISAPISMAAIKSATSLSKPPGLLCIYYEKTVETNYQREEALILRVTHVVEAPVAMAAGVATE